MGTSPCAVAGNIPSSLGQRGSATRQDGAKAAHVQAAKAVGLPAPPAAARSICHSLRGSVHVIHYRITQEACFCRNTDRPLCSAQVNSFFRNTWIIFIRGV
jgi:hypothetical protein